MICHNKFRSWLEIPANGALAILNPSLFYNIIDISTKHTQCQIILRNKLKNSKCCDIRFAHNETSKDTNIQYDRYLSAKEALKEIWKDKIGNMVTNVTSQSLVIKAMWEEAFTENVKHWQLTISSLPKNIYNFTTRYLNNTLPTLKNMSLWKKTTNSLCSAYLNPQTLQHVVSTCNVHLEHARTFHLAP